MIKFWGAESEHGYIYVHGLNGSKNDAESFAGIAENFGLQVLSFDVNSFDPVNTLPQLEEIYTLARERWRSVGLYAVSLGAWFSMACFHDKPIARTLLVSPVVSMKNLIDRMMNSAGVTPEQLRTQGTIANLSWDYYSFAREHEISQWPSDTRILYPQLDDITPRTEIEQFAEKFACGLTVMPDAEHWIHTQAQTKILRAWEESNMPS